MRALPGDLVPFADERIERWRNLEAGGIKSAHSPTGLTALALVDDVWLSRKDGSLRIVDYKTHGSVRSFDLKSGWGTTYQRQLEFYAFALMNSGEVDMPISSTAHLVVVSPDRTAAEFGDVLQFDAELFTHACDITWIDDELADVLACLESDEPPGAKDDCTFCRYLSEVTAIG